MPASDPVIAPASPAPDGGPTIAVTAGTGSDLAVTVAGRLELATVAAAAARLLGPIRQARPARVTLDAAALDYCDGFGLGLLAEVRRVLAGWDGRLTLTNLRPDLRSLVDLATLPDPAAPQLAQARRAGLLEVVGRQVAGAAVELRETAAFLGQLIVAIGWALAHPRQVRWRDCLVTADRVGTDAVPVVCLLGFLIGTILAFQAGPPVERLGGRDLIPTLVSISVVRELGPLIACILLAGRTGSAFAAELGTMTVTEEVAALRAMGLDPVRFLAVPRALAVSAVAPVLALLSSGTGVFGGFCVMATHGFTLQRYAAQVRDAVVVRDLLGGEAKTVVFGLIVGGIGCLRGLRTGAGPGAVGDSATRAVVAAIVLIIVADGAFGVAYYYLGI